MEISFSGDTLIYGGDVYTIDQITEPIIYSVQLENPELASQIINARSRCFGSAMLHRGETRTVSNPSNPEELIPYWED